MYALWHLLGWCVTKQNPTFGTLCCNLNQNAEHCTDYSLLISHMLSKCNTDTRALTALRVLCHQGTATDPQNFVLGAPQEICSTMRLGGNHT